MKRYLAFVCIGSVFVAVEEFLTVAVLKKDLASYCFTLLVVFPVFLTLVYFSSKGLDRLFAREASRDLAHFVAYGWVGLMIEWFVMGLSPWSNPDANPLLMLIFQLGMFSFWTTVAFAPRLFLGSRGLNRKIKRRILRFYVPFFLMVYVVGLSVPEELKFGTIIPLVIVGHLALNFFYYQYFAALFGWSRTGVEGP